MVGCAFLLSLGWALGLQAGENLLPNPGFESSKEVSLVAGGADCWGILLERGVQIEAGAAVTMPVWWTPDDGNGWAKGSATAFRYITGQAGAEVCSGRHAVFIAAARGMASVMGGNRFSVVEDSRQAGARRALPLKEPFFFSFCAKGQGTVACRLYTYPFGRENYGLYKATPPQFTISAAWKTCTGTLQFTELEHFTEPGRVADSGAILVLEVSNGAATIDDVGLFLSPPSELHAAGPAPENK